MDILAFLLIIENFEKNGKNTHKDKEEVWVKHDSEALPLFPWNREKAQAQDIQYRGVCKCMGIEAGF